MQDQRRCQPTLCGAHRARIKGARVDARGDTTFLPNSPHKRSKDPAAKASSARRRGGRLRVLMANEPRAYREGIAAVIGQLRPEGGIETVETEALDTAIGRFSPAMVI